MQQCNHMPLPPAAQGWVLYDGQCSFCRKWTARWTPLLLSRGFAPLPLQDPVVAELLAANGDLLRDILLLKTDGTLIRGADVYLHVARRVWWLSPFAILFSLPGLKALLNFCYRKFADNRYCISGSHDPVSCRLGTKY